MSHNGKVTLSLMRYHAIQPCGEEEVQLHTFTTFILDAGEWSKARLCIIIRGDPNAYWIWG
jgi:hypothetical protein